MYPRHCFLAHYLTRGARIINCASFTLHSATLFSISIPFGANALSIVKSNVYTWPHSSSTRLDSMSRVALEWIVLVYYTLDSSHLWIKHEIRLLTSLGTLIVILRKEPAELVTTSSLCLGVSRMGVGIVDIVVALGAGSSINWTIGLPFDWIFGITISEANQQIMKS